MRSETPIEAAGHLSSADEWTLVTRIVFRFCFIYFALFSLTTKIAGGLILLPDRSISGLGILWPLRPFTFWVATKVFGITEALQYTGNSWDTNFYWVQAAWVLAISVVASGIWCVIDRRRLNYGVLHEWTRVFLRLAIASQMFEYGMTKVIPVQFPSPSLITLVTPVGSVSLQGLLWTFVGASPVYQILTGLVEVTGGALLLFGRTTMLGACITLAGMLQIFAFNMLYDVGVKIVSFHLILMTLFLLAPQVPRLLDFFLRNRPVAASNRSPLFGTRRANRIALAAQVIFGLYMLGIYTNVTRIYWYEGGGGSPRSALYGIWNVEELSIDGQVRAAELNDYDRRWRRVIFDEPGAMVFQRTDDSFSRYGVSIDLDRNILALSKGESRRWSSGFTFQRPADDRLVLEGDMDGYVIRMELGRVQADTFQVLNSHFRWVRPPDP